MSEAVAISVMLSAGAYFSAALATRLWMSVVSGVIVTFLVAGFVIGAFAHVGGPVGEVNLIPTVTLGIGVPVVLSGGLGLAAQRYRGELNRFAYAVGGSSWLGFGRWILRARNLLLSLGAVFVLWHFGIREGASPVWMAALWVIVAGVTLAFSDGLGVRANVLIANVLPRTDKRRRVMQFAIGLGAFLFLVLAVRLPVIADETQAYGQLVCFSFAGALIAAAHVRLYGYAVAEASDSAIASLIDQTRRIAVEIAWGLAVIGASFAPTVLGWSWPATFLVAVVISLSVAVFRIHRPRAGSHARERTAS